MKRITAFIFLLVVMCNNAFAQSLSDELEKIKQIKLLKSTRRDVQRILRGYKENYDSVRLSEIFSSKKIKIEISYTQGDCPKGIDQWNVGKGKVDYIHINFNDSVKLKDLKYDLSGFRKDQMPPIIINREDVFVYHSKNEGIDFLVENEKLNSISFIPSKNQASLLCKSEQSKRLKEFYSRESFFETLPLPQ